LGLTAVGAQAQIAMDIASLDENGDGVVNKEEFMYCVRDTLLDRPEQTKASRKYAYLYAERLYEASDVDGDGVLSEREVEYGKYMSKVASHVAMQIPEDVPSLEEVTDKVFGDSVAKAILLKADADGDGRVDMDEFLEAAGREMMGWGITRSSVNDPQVQEGFRTCFQRADMDNDTYLSAREAHFASFLTYHMTVFELTNSMMSMLDLDGDGKVQWLEVAEAPLTMVVGEDGGLRRFIHDMFSEVDADGDSCLDLHELQMVGARVLGAIAAGQ